MVKEENKVLGIAYEKFQNVVKKALKEKFDIALISMQSISDGEYLAECEGILGQKIIVSISAKTYNREITEQDLENFLVLMNINKADQGFFITQTDFTKEAKFFAREHQIKLLSREELSKILESAHVEEKKEMFAIGEIDNEVRKIFDNHRRKNFFGLFGFESIHLTEKKARPIGLFTLKSKYKKEEKRVYIDLSTVEIYKVEGRKIAKDNSLKKILELPEDARKLLFDFISSKSFEYDEVPKKELSILEKKGFVKIKTLERGFLLSLIDEFLWGIQTLTDGFGEILRMKPSVGSASATISSKKYAVLNMKLIKFQKYHDLDFYLEKSFTTTKDFHSDEKNYDTEEIKNVLSEISGSEVSFSNIIYLPYYECTYKNNGSFRKEQIFPIKFKSLLKDEHSYNAVYNFIDKAPEVPFLFFAFMYAAYIYPNLERVAHVFYSSLVFVFVLFAIGLLLKYIFKTDRKVQYTSAPIVKYGFPSLHSLISIGTIVFVYFIPDIGPFMSLILAPLGVIYIYSRLKLGVHCLNDVIGGAIIGAVLGTVLGYYLLSTQILRFPFTIEVIFTILFFILPVFSIWYRIKTGYLR